MNSEQSDMRTPLSRVRGLGTAKDGTEHFIRQRMTAIALVPLTLYFIWVMMQLIGAPYEDVITCFRKPSVAIIMLIVLGAGFYHMKLGMQVIIEDYVHGLAGKALLIANTFFPIVLTAACGFAILKLAFGG